MSLDVYLVSPEPIECHECGHNTKDEHVYKANITHNLNTMADAAGIYEHLWRPEEVGVKKASDLIGPLSDGLALLKADPEKFEKLNSENGYGLYEDFVPFVEKYLAACKESPDALVRVSR